MAFRLIPQSFFGKEHRECRQEHDSSHLPQGITFPPRPPLCVFSIIGYNLSPSPSSFWPLTSRISRDMMLQYALTLVEAAKISPCSAVLHVRELSFGFTYCLILMLGSNASLKDPLNPPIFPSSRKTSPPADSLKHRHFISKKGPKWENHDWRVQVSYMVV